MASEQVESRDHFLSWLPLWVLIRRKLANYIISLSRLSDTLVVEIVWTWFCINDPLPVSLLGGLNCFVSLGMKLSCSRSQRSWWEEMPVSYFSYIMIWKITGYYLFYSESSPLTPSISSRHYPGNPAKITGQDCSWYVAAMDEGVRYWYWLVVLPERIGCWGK